jgi:hypothetical protein
MKYQAILVADLLAFAFFPGALGVTAPLAWTTSSDGVYKLSSYTAPVKGTGSSGGASAWALQVDDTATGHKQSITGFGGISPRCVRSET